MIAQRNTLVSQYQIGFRIGHFEENWVYLNKFGFGEDGKIRDA